jgi:homoserine kinase
VRFVDGPVRVSVPATSANLGPGFDALGLALSLRDELEAEVLPDGLVVEVAGAGAGAVPLDDGHLVVKAMRAAFAAMDHSPPGLRLACRNVIPHGRGLGSSSAAIVGGLQLARSLVTDGSAQLAQDAILQLAVELEGHPDNVAPALLGGFVVSGRDEDGSAYAVRAAVDPRIGTMVFVPPDAVATETARGLLPDVVPHHDAAANAGRVALLMTALAGRPELLLKATEDRLHQQYRAPAMPESAALVATLRADGVPAVISGAGPTVLAFVAGAEPGPSRLAERCPAGWECLELAVDPVGADVG